MKNNIDLKKQYIKKWCENALIRTKTINAKSSSSYGLKHICEGAIGVYVSNEEIIECMESLGFIKRRQIGYNFQFNISIIINNVVFKDKLDTLYSNEYRCFNDKSKTILL
jgi:hypothetical protein